jgi:hypothetical protein
MTDSTTVTNATPSNTPFNGNAVGNNSQMAMLSNIQLGVSDITSIATAKQERSLKEALEAALKVVRQAEDLLTKCRKHYDTYLADQEAEARRIVKGTFINLYLNGQYVGINDKTADITNVTCRTVTNNIGETIYDLSVTAIYKSKTTNITWSETFTQPYPTAEVRKLQGLIDDAQTNVTVATREATRIRHQLADLPALERQAKAALAGAVLQSQGDNGTRLFNAVTQGDATKALPPVS